MGDRAVRNCRVEALKIETDQLNQQAALDWQRRVRDLINQTPEDRMPVLDLRPVVGHDLAGLSLLLRACDYAKYKQRKLGYSARSRTLLSSIKLLGLDRVMDFVNLPDQ